MKVFLVRGVVQEGAVNDADVSVTEVYMEVFASDETMAKKLALFGNGPGRRIGKVIYIEERGEIDDSLVIPGIKYTGVKTVWKGLFESPDNPYKGYEAF